MESAYGANVRHGVESSPLTLKRKERSWLWCYSKNGRFPSTGLKGKLTKGPEYLNGITSARFIVLMQPILGPSLYRLSSCYCRQANGIVDRKINAKSSKNQQVAILLIGRQ